MKGFIEVTASGTPQGITAQSLIAIYSIRAVVDVSEVPESMIEVKGAKCMIVLNGQDDPGFLSDSYEEVKAKIQENQL